MAVLIKGQSIRGTQKSRDHYLRGPENEHIKVLEVKGFVTQDPEEALRMIELSAKGTRCQNPLYSTKINPETDRLWTPEEVFRAADLLEENLGLTGHQRVIIEHKKEGRIHYHALWNRFPPEGGPAVHMSRDYDAHQNTQKQLEREFKLRPMMAKGRNFRDSEVKWAQRLGFDIFKMREQITADFNKARSGQEFKAMLEAQGIVLCRGDKSQFVIILPWGQHKALSSMMMGRPRKAILRRALGGIDISKLPTVQEGKEIVRARLPKRQPKAYRRVGQTYVRRGPSPAAAWRAGRQITVRKPKLSAHPAIVFSPKPAPQPEYRPAPESARTALAREKDSPFLPVAGDEPEWISFADIAYQEEYKKWEGLIEAAAKDRSVPKAQRKANVAALRERQKIAAKAVHKRVREEEKSMQRAARRERRRSLGLSGIEPR